MSLCYFLLTPHFLIPQQGYQWDTVSKVRQESFLWPLTLPWPAGLRFIRVVLLLSSQGSSTVQRQTEPPAAMYTLRSLFLEGLSCWPGPLSTVNDCFKAKGNTCCCNCLNASIYSILQRNEMWNVDFSWWIIPFCTTALEFVCFSCAFPEHYNMPFT